MAKAKRMPRKKDIRVYKFDDEVLHPYEQFRYESLIGALNLYCPPSVCKRSIQFLDELITSLLEDKEDLKGGAEDGESKKDAS